MVASLFKYIKWATVFFIAYVNKLIYVACKQTKT